LTLEKTKQEQMVAQANAQIAREETRLKTMSSMHVMWTSKSKRQRERKKEKEALKLQKKRTNSSSGEEEKEEEEEDEEDETPQQEKDLEAELEGEAEEVKEIASSIRLWEKQLQEAEKKLKEIAQQEKKMKEGNKLRGPDSNIREVNERNARADREIARQMSIKEERERREQEEEMKKTGKKKVFHLDPFKRRATRPSNNMDDDDESKVKEKEREMELMRLEQEEAAEKAANEMAMMDLSSSASTPASSAALLSARLAEQVLSSRFAGKRQGSSLLSSFSHPPTLSEQLGQILLLLHSEPISVDLDSKSELREQRERRERERQHQQSDHSSWIHLAKAPNDSVKMLTLDEYWARQEAGDKDD